MSTPRAFIRSDFAEDKSIHTMKTKAPLHLCDEEGFRRYMERLTDEMVKLTERLKEKGRVKDYSHIKEIWLGRAWDSYMKQFNIEEMCE